MMQAASSPAPSRFKVWFAAVRPYSFTTSTVPILAASALALYEGELDLLALGLMLVASMATHAGCNIANDLYDDRSGVDRQQKVGHGEALQRGWIDHREMTLGIVVAFAIALLAALPIMIDIGRPIIVLGIASAAAAYFYTGGPFPLAYWALGEVTVFLAMGVGMVAGAFYVHTGRVGAGAWLLGAAIGCLAAAILHANNIRDADVDRAHRKRTLANLLPRWVADGEFRALLIVPFLLLVLMILLDPGAWPLVMVALALPRTIALIRTAKRSHTILELNRLLRQSAGLHMLFGLLVTVGYLIAAALERLSA